jgi:hypothetical protein
MGRRPSSSSATSASSVRHSNSGSDLKLRHLVQKLLSSSPLPMSAPALTTQLRTLYREYQRQDEGILQAQVQVIIQQIRESSLQPSQQQQQQQPDATPLSSRKRKQQFASSVSTLTVLPPSLEVPPDRDAADELAYDEAVAATEAQQAALQAGGGLNASLLQRYRQVSAARQASESSMAPLDATNDDDNNDNASTASVSCDTAADNAPSTVALSASSTVTPLVATDNSAALDSITPPPPSSGTPRSSHTTVLVKRRKVKRKPSLHTTTTNNNNSPYSHDNPDDPLSCLTPVPRPPQRFKDLGGLDHVVQQVQQLVAYPLLRPEVYRHLGVEPPRGVLLRGPPGTGKTHVANAGTCGRIQ